MPTEVYLPSIDLMERNSGNQFDPKIRKVLGSGHCWIEKIHLLYRVGYQQETD